MARKARPDFDFANHGSITILTPLSRRGKAWAAENIHQDGETQYWGSDGIVIEPRYASAIVDGAIGDGLWVREI